MSRAVVDRIRWMSLIHKVDRNWSQLKGNEHIHNKWYRKKVGVEEIEKIKLDPYLTLYSRIYSRWINASIMKNKTKIFRRKYGIIYF